MFGATVTSKPNAQLASGQAFSAMMTLGVDRRSDETVPSDP